MWEKCAIFLIKKCPFSLCTYLLLEEGTIRAEEGVFDVSTMAVARTDVEHLHKEQSKREKSYATVSFDRQEWAG